MRGGDLIWELYKLREFMIADFPDFDRIVRQRGTATLRAADVSPRIADELVTAVLDILRKVIRDNLN